MRIFSRSKEEKKEKVVDPKIKELVDDLRDKDEKVRKKAVQKLRVIGKPAVEPLIETFSSPGSIIWGPYDALSKIGEPAIEPLIKALMDKKNNELVRRGAAFTIRIMSERAHSYYKPLIPVLKDKAVEPLINLLTKNYCKRIRWTETDRWIYGHICAALGEIGDPRAIKPLKKALETWGGDKRAENVARNSLNTIAKQQKIHSE
jgi:HEAT repeat protein